MGNKQAYPNTLVTYTIQIFVGGNPATGTLSNASLTLDGGSAIPGTVSGMDISVLIPNDQPIANDVSVALTWTQVVGGNTSTQTASYFIDIVAAPTGSSQSYVPTNIVRQCHRLAEPADTTVEQFVASEDPRSPSLAIYIDIPYPILRSAAANLPSSGPDLVSFNYVDAQGNAGVVSINCTLWMSDNGYVFISANNGVQYLIASVRADFWQTNAPTINARNTMNGATTLQACANAIRYGMPALLTNQAIPSLFIYDGQTLSSATSSTPNVI